MHVEGFSKALTNGVNRYARARNLLKEKEDNFKGEDIREGLTAIISVRLRDPQFEGQTKAKLGNVTIRSLVERSTNKKLNEWLEENPREAGQIVQKSTAGGPGPHGGPGRARPDASQVGARRGRTAREALRLLLPRPQGVRAVHCRGELRRRFGQGRPRPPDAGHPAHPGQDPQRRAGPHRQDAEERRDPGADLGHRGRPGRRVRRDENPVSQGDPAGRRRRRREPHPDACCSPSSSGR